MSAIVRIQTKVQTGGKVEITDPHLTAGETVEVTVTPVGAQDTANKRSALDIIESSPPQRLFKTADEVDAYLKGERDSWDR